MKLSEIILEFELIKSSHGDLDVYSSEDSEGIESDDIRLLFSSDGWIVVID